MDIGTALSIALRPIGALLVITFVLAPIRRGFERWIPEGKIKRVLLRQVGDKPPAQSG